MQITLQVFRRPQLPLRRPGLMVEKMNVSIHVDCDSLWVYASEYGAPPDYQDASIYEESLPELVEMLEKRNLHATFFVIGKDLKLPACRAFCRQVLDRGHQIGNHSYSHLQDVHKLTQAERRLEILNCHNAVQQSLGYECTGLRMPGYYFDRNIAEILDELNYAYDSSVLPGFGIYMMGLFYRLFNSLGKNKRFGRNWYLFASHSPYRVNVGEMASPSGKRRFSSAQSYSCRCTVLLSFSGDYLT